MNDKLTSDIPETHFILIEFSDSSFARLINILKITSITYYYTTKNKLKIEVRAKSSKPFSSASWKFIFFLHKFNW